MISGHDTLIRTLEDRGVDYRSLSHPAAADTVGASVARGHSPREAAKTMVVRVVDADGSERHVMVTVPGDCRVDLPAVAAVVGAESAALAAPEVATRLTGCDIGTIMPFGDDTLPGVADPWLLCNERVFFNAARHDESVSITSFDFVVLARPVLAAVAERNGPHAPG